MSDITTTPSPANAQEARMLIFAACIVCDGMSGARAYKAAGFRGKSSTCASGASVLRRHPYVQREMMRLRREADKKNVLTLAEKRAFLRDVVVNGAGKVNEDDRLCQSITRTVRTDSKGNTIERVTVDMPDKLRALELDGKLAGELVGGITGDAETAVPLDDAALDDRLGRILGAMMGVAARDAVPDNPRDVTPVREADMEPQPALPAEAVELAQSMATCRPKRAGR